MVDIEFIKKTLIERLHELGIDDKICIKLRDFEKCMHGRRRYALGLYRSMSQFGRMPIFWINTHRAHEASEVYDTACHEYGHVVVEYLRLHHLTFYRNIQMFWRTEEDFCEEGMMRFLTCDYSFLSNSQLKLIETILQWYSGEVQFETI